jgi:hypothetical protein
MDHKLSRLRRANLFEQIGEHLCDTDQIVGAWQALDVVWRAEFPFRKCTSGYGMTAHFVPIASLPEGRWAPVDTM